MEPIPPSATRVKNWWNLIPLRLRELHGVTGEMESVLGYSRDNLAREGCHNIT
jgi:hypothetical protein